jgi:hypothetical protein
MQEHVCEQRQEMELGTTFEQLLDRYMMLPFEEREWRSKSARCRSAGRWRDGC